MKSLVHWDAQDGGGVKQNDGVEFYEKFLQGAGVTDSSHGFSCDISRDNFVHKYFSFCENLDRDPRVGAVEPKSLLVCASA